MVTYTFNSPCCTGGRYRRVSLSLRLHRVLGQPGIHSEILSQKIKQQLIPKYIPKENLRWSASTEQEQEPAYDRIEYVDEYDTGSEISGIIFEPEEEEVIESVSENSISANSITADVSEESKGEDSL